MKLKIRLKKLSVCLLIMVFSFAQSPFVFSMAYTEPEDDISVTIATTGEDEDGFDGVEDNTRKASKEESSGSSENFTNTYIVQPGDCLSAIAQRLLGNGSRWPELVSLNKDRYPTLESNPNLIYPGWQLIIPGGSSSQVATKNSSGNSNTFTPATGSSSEIGARVAKEAMNLVHRYPTASSFPYDPLTEGGVLGCAQVVTTALKAAGVVSQICLNVNGTVGMLQNVGWKLVDVPPYQSGDVLTWTVSGRPNAHIGIVVKQGNSYKAMNNSSSMLRPIVMNINYYPVTKVLRKI